MTRHRPYRQAYSIAEADRRELSRLVAEVAILVMLFFIVGAAFTVYAPPKADGYTGTWPATGPYAPAEADLRARINREHYAACRRYMTNDTQLVAGARWRSKTMATQGWFSHVDRYGHRLGYFLNLFHVSYRYAGEDIAWNAYPPDVSAQGAFASFLTSRAHLALIRDCHFTRVGVGSYRVPGRIVWTVWFKQP